MQPHVGLIPLLALILTSCGEEREIPTSQREGRLYEAVPVSDRAANDDEEIDDRDGESISAYPGQIKGGETYQEYDNRRDSYAGSRGSFADDGCTVDCGGHEAGYAWAENHGVADPDECARH